MTTVIDSKGRITIPKELRKSLGLKIGEELELVIINDKLVIQRKLSTQEFHMITDKLADKFAKQISAPIDLQKLV